MNHFSENLSQLIQSKLGIHIGSEKIKFYMEGLYRKSSLINKYSEEKYLEYLTEKTNFAENEWKIILDALNISETYFLRDAGQFEILEKHIIPSILEKNNVSKKINIWSAGCSTGEEPYSIAILLNELLPNIASWDISVLATDVNEKSIEKAMEGNYMEWSFREMPPEKVTKHFTQRKNLYQVNDSIKKNIQFRVNNLLETAYHNEFDLILCRNVFIYFDDNSKKTVLNKFDRSIKENGYMLLGHSEAPHLIPDSFESIVNQKSIYYRKKIISSPVNISETNNLPKTKIEIKKNISQTTPQKVFKAQFDNSKNKIELAKNLTNNGHLPEAEKILQNILAENPSNHEAIFLQGQILEAKGNFDSAENRYKKAIYLEPLFLESYLNLSNLYTSLNKMEEAIKIKNAALYCFTENQNLKQIYSEKGYHIESLETFFKEESGLWL